MASAAAAGDTESLLADLLSIVLDINPFAWHASAEPSSLSDEGTPDTLTFDDAVKSLLVLANAHMALRFENHVMIYAAGHGQSTLLYSSIDMQMTGNRGTCGAIEQLSQPDADEKTSMDSNSYQTFRIMDEAIARALRTLQGDQTWISAEQDAPVAFASALAKTLCHVNRIAKDDTLPRLQARILIISVSGETSTQYISIMNCIFAAQKASIPIDVCKVFGEDTVFLQQASHLTKASYYRLERRSGLLQYLLMSFLPGIGVRKHLHLPSQEQIDLRAACFCHKRIVDIGYVCSVCLSIFCSPIPVCLTCRTKFPMASLRRLINVSGASLVPPPLTRRSARP